VLFKGAEAIENASKLQTIVFDKTGTLTKGEPSVTDVVGNHDAQNSQFKILKLAASTEKNSEHPLGEAIVQGAESRGLVLVEAESFNSIPGHGVEAQVEGREVLLGNRKLMRERSVNFTQLMGQAEAFEADGKTVMFVALDGQPAGLIAVADTLK
jgi:Cu+-exporting ATPase